MLWSLEPIHMQNTNREERQLQRTPIENKVTFSSSFTWPSHPNNRFKPRKKVIAINKNNISPEMYRLLWEFWRNWKLCEHWTKSRRWGGGVISPKSKSPGTSILALNPITKHFFNSPIAYISFTIRGSNP